MLRLSHIQTACTNEIKKVRAILEYFCCVIGNTAEAWSCCSSRSDRDMLRVWFSCTLFVPIEHGVKVTAPTDVCTKDMQHVTARFLVSEGIKGAEINRKLATKYATMTCVRVDRNV
jgi:hypothetical protein